MMMTRFRVFIGAPLTHDNADVSVPYHWQTATLETHPASMPALSYPPATLEAANRRISFIYQNIIFGESDGLENYLISGDVNLHSPSRDNDIEGQMLL